MPQPPAASPRAEGGRTTSVGVRSPFRGGSNEPGSGFTAAQRPVILSGTRHGWSSELSGWEERRGGYLNTGQLSCLSPCQAALPASQPEAFITSESNHVFCRRGLRVQLWSTQRVAASAALQAKPPLLRRPGTLG